MTDTRLNLLILFTLQKYRPLHVAAQQTSRELIEAVLEDPAVDLNAQDDSLMTPCHLAAAKGPSVRSPSLCRVVMTIPRILSSSSSSVCLLLFARRP